MFVFGCYLCGFQFGWFGVNDDDVFFFICFWDVMWYGKFMVSCCIVNVKGIFCLINLVQIVGGVNVWVNIFFLVFGDFFYNLWVSYMCVGYVDYVQKFFSDCVLGCCNIRDFGCVECWQFDFLFDFFGKIEMGCVVYFLNGNDVC